VAETEIIELEIRSVGVWLLELYLQELGGTPVSPGVLAGQGWQAHLRPAEPVAVGSLRIGRVVVQLEGEPTAVREVAEQLRWKAFRGGG
jgi:orotidine-5'-phosphate decarboxylase